MQFMNRLNMLSNSHLEILKIPFAKNPFSTPLSQLLSLSSCSSILLSRFFSLQRILPTATRFPLFHPAQAISLSSQLSFLFLSPPPSFPAPLSHFLTPKKKNQPLSAPSFLLPQTVPPFQSFFSRCFPSSQYPISPIPLKKTIFFFLLLGAPLLPTGGRQYSI